ncbi:uncharacterized protein LOC107883673 [Acyrthosiphon pisum]|uniref:Copia protein n=1 Tax=Acyrthosiphon pisum TaxID=7029 RepID=A0A8R2H4I7_ACYPI|nr:uncharacterized protein LOC107883673 [Acyrthosiphon pisum]|eukprot:XP_016659665.1 PREDICTED: uncharacterized protein LOC107883673 [Acyrthosiphon pisum]
MTAAEIFDVVTGKSKKPVLTKSSSETEDDARKSILYEQKSATSISLLQEKFYGYVMDPVESMACHTSKLENLSKQLVQSGEPISDSMLMTKILMTLPDTYKHFYSAWDSMSS